MRDVLRQAEWAWRGNELGIRASKIGQTIEAKRATLAGKSGRVLG
ncbi:inverse autotransporter beta-barrel domain-containing protein (plasmid) [Acetobacter orientalis]|uniref:Inverse autotransporter beta-barrel domain-containing protein n=1 Tax=Acetobacter orientalis TaxID=146474 RepID=A0A2Z5ZMF0_9PROT|nr:inverse autotransporter beta-barrel domain-containing protein [Acetobacter orientalis]